MLSKTAILSSVPVQLDLVRRRRGRLSTALVRTGLAQFALDPESVLALSHALSPKPAIVQLPCVAAPRTCAERT